MAYKNDYKTEVMTLVLNWLSVKLSRSALIDEVILFHKLAAFTRHARKVGFITVLIAFRYNWCVCMASGYVIMNIMYKFKLVT